MRKQGQELTQNEGGAGQPTGCRGKIMLVLFGVVSAFIIGEVYGRIASPYLTPEELRRQSLEYEASLFARHTFPQHEQDKYRDGEINYYINERGYRGENFDVPKPPDTIRVIVLGGSAAFDVLADRGHDWPTLAEQIVHDQGYTNVEIINASIPGHATWDSLGRLYTEIWTFEPDYIAVYHGWNDIKYFAELSDDTTLLRSFAPAKTVGNDPQSDDPAGALVRNPLIYYAGPVDKFLSSSQFYLHLRQGYFLWKYGSDFEGAAPQGTGKESDYPGGFGATGPDQFALNLRLIVDTADNIGAIPLLITQAHLPVAASNDADRERIKYNYVQLSHEGLIKAFTEIESIIVEVGEEKETAVLDLTALNGQSNLFNDHVHTTAAGSQAIAEAFAAFLIEQLETAP
ncbi:MAG: SGNH/GDSL hydrolase family protein [Anaerolineales bacterium]|nr:SGNH/GDSL hydrolase family protein [Anaerolineales bacterium]